MFCRVIVVIVIISKLHFQHSQCPGQIKLMIDVTVPIICDEELSHPFLLPPPGTSTRSETKWD